MCRGMIRKRMWTKSCAGYGRLGRIGVDFEMEEEENLVEKAVYLEEKGEAEN